MHRTREYAFDRVKPVYCGLYARPDAAFPGQLGNELAACVQHARRVCLSSREKKSCLLRVFERFHVMPGLQKQYTRRELLRHRIQFGPEPRCDDEQRCSLRVVGFPCNVCIIQQCSYARGQLLRSGDVPDKRAFHSATLPPALSWVLHLTFFKVFLLEFFYLPRTQKLKSRSVSDCCVNWSTVDRAKHAAFLIVVGARTN